jgi:hypothetical protein
MVRQRAFHGCGGPGLGPDLLHLKEIHGNLYLQDGVPIPHKVFISTREEFVDIYTKIS